MSTKDDRALLEAAAKAAGIEFEAVMLGSTLSGGVILKGRAGYWNPLNDDGDALRLAVKLRIDLGLDGEENAYAWLGHDQDLIDEPFGNDPCAATRRAIVRAAAAMAATQEEQKG